jgi:YVTN family beta-propeller protein
MRTPFLALLVLLTGHAGAAATVDAAAPHVVQRYAIGGAGGWDYMSVDTQRRHVFVTRGDHVMVVDADSGSLAGDLVPIHHAHGVALVPQQNRGYVSNGASDSVSVFDLQTLKVTGEIPVTGKDPDAILFDPASRHVFTFNGHSDNATVIDPVTQNVVTSIELAGNPEFAVSDGRGHVFVNIEDKNQLVEIDSRKSRVSNVWSLGECDSPSGLAIDTVHARLFSVCANRQMAVTDSHDGHAVASVPIGDGPDAVAYDAASATVYSSNSDGTLTVVRQDDADHYHVLANVTTPLRSRTLVLDPTTHRVFLASAEFEPAPPTGTNERAPRPVMKPGSFALLVVAAAEPGAADHPHP